MPSPTYILGIEFVAGSFTNVTEDLRGADVSRAVGGLFSPLAPGEMLFMLENFDGTYSPQNTASTLTGLMRPGIDARLQATWSGSTYDIFRGTIQAWEVQPQMGEAGRMSAVTAVDKLKIMQQRNVTTSLFTATNVASVFKSIFDVASLATTAHSVDAIADVSPFSWFKDRDAMGAVQEVLEAGFYHAYVAPDGVIRVRARYWDNLSSIQASLRATSTSTTAFYEMRHGLTMQDVYNDIKVEGLPRVQDTDTRTVAFIIDKPTIPASGNLGFFVSYLDPDNLEAAPANSIVSPVQSVDFFANDAADGSGTDRTSTTSLVGFTAFGETAVVSLFNAHTDVVFLTQFVIRGKSVQRKPQISVRLQQNSSQELYSPQAFVLTNDLMAERGYLGDYAEFLRLRQPDPVDRLAPISLKNDFTQQLGIDLTDVIHIHETNTGLDKAFVVMGIEHEIRGDGGGFEHVTRYNVQTRHDFQVLILDDPELGVLDSRRLGF